MRLARYRAARRFWRGLTALTAAFTTLTLTASVLLGGFRSDLDRIFHTSSVHLAAAGTDPDMLYPYPSDYASTAELVQAAAALGEQISAEGSVLLKNNGALPLSSEEKEKISLLGFCSYYPLCGGGTGSVFTPNTGTSADTVDFCQALTERNFVYNPALESAYETLVTFYAPEGLSPDVPDNTGNGLFSDREPPPEMLDQVMPRWRESLGRYNIFLVTIGRAGEKNARYIPGKNGVNTNGNPYQQDPLGLSGHERDIIETVTEAREVYGGKVIVLLNTSNPMEIRELMQNSAIDAVLQIGFPGGYGFRGICDLLDGTVSPSGRLTDTWAVTNALSPAAQNEIASAWANQPDGDGVVIEAENIYTGYRYYETRYADTVMHQGSADSSAGSNGETWNYTQEVDFPFGFGMSYTTFSQTLEQVDINHDTAYVSVNVKNTGNIPGKDTVQFYASAPYTEYDREHHVEKSAVQLLDYAKTGLLSPGASETVNLTVDLFPLASWDSGAVNASGTQGCYILDAGTYYFTVGHDVHDALNRILAARGYGTADGMTADGIPDGMTADGTAENVQSWKLDSPDTRTFARTKNGTAVKNRLTDLDFNYWQPDTVTWLSRSDWEGTFPRQYTGLSASAEMLAVMSDDNYTIQSDGSDVIFGVNHSLTIADLKGVDSLSDPRWMLLADQLTLADCMISVGFGASPRTVSSIGAPSAVHSGGTNGISDFPLGQYARTQPGTGDPCTIAADDPNAVWRGGVMPCAVVLGQTFSKELAETYGKLMGNYSLWANIPIWQGVGIHPHRSPYNAGNYENYSEDPVLCGLQGAAVVSGTKPYGLIAVLCGAGFRDSESSRNGTAVFMTEQKAREGSLLALQIPLERADASGIMTGAGRAGVYHISAHPAFLRNIIRGEWGFNGMISEAPFVDPADAVLKEAVLNGVTMSGAAGEDALEAVAAYYDYWTPEQIQKDSNLCAALKQNMLWQAYTLAGSNALDGLAPSVRLSGMRAWYDCVLWGITAGGAVLTFLNLTFYFHAVRREDEALRAERNRRSRKRMEQNAEHAV